MKLPPEVNLMAVVHYMQALDYQRRANQIVGILGSKTPHIQNLAVGGVANPINPDSQSTLTLERLYKVKALIDEIGDLRQSGLPARRRGDRRALRRLDRSTAPASPPTLPFRTCRSTPRARSSRCPAATSRTAIWAASGRLANYQDGYFEKGVKESSKHAWYGDSGAPLHPYDGETEPKYTGFEDDGKYSWVKAPTFYDERAQVGPLANVLTMYLAGHEPTKRHLGRLLAIAGKVAGAEIPLTALHSTIGRHAARAVRCAVLAETLDAQWALLMQNIAKGDFATFNRPTFPKGEIRGFGCHEAPRGVLSHWAVIRDGKIANYQAVVPSTWNAGPRDDKDAMGPYEASLVGNPVADPEKPLEVIRTVHSFDPCLACAIHMLDGNGGEVVRVKAL